MSRFLGVKGRPALKAAMCAQAIVSGDESLADALSKIAKVRICKAKCRLIKQGSEDNAIYFIILGQFGVLVNGRSIAQRNAGQTVGEMALIDPRAKRSATVVALERSVVARVPSEAFIRLADIHPKLWRRLAAELGDRLRQRNMSVRQRNPIPKIFIGSSSESLQIAKGIRKGLAGTACQTLLWTGNVFRPSDAVIEALERIAFEADFSVLVLGPDDKVHYRGKVLDSPRDNVIFELGLLMGAIGRKRTFFVVPSGLDLKIPTDLHGVTYLPYKPGKAKGLPKRLESVLIKIRKQLKSLGAR